MDSSVLTTLCAGADLNAPQIPTPAQLRMGVHTRLPQVHQTQSLNGTPDSAQLHYPGSSRRLSESPCTT
eukprot:3476220-Amphidinium_carterae.1